MLIKRETDRWTLTSYRDKGRNIRIKECQYTTHLHITLFQVVSAACVVFQLFFLYQAALTGNLDHDP